MAAAKSRNSEAYGSRLRLARFLSQGPARVSKAARAGSIVLESGENMAAAAGAETLAAMARDGLLTRKADHIVLSGAGLAWLKRQSAGAEPFRAQQSDLAEATVDIGGRRTAVTVNLAESPLAQIARIKGKDGKPFLCETEWRAGERLRADYTRACLMPRLGVNWEATASAGRRGGPGAREEFSDAVLAARLRVENAIEATGPELAGVLVDVCCFLKGLECVERERNWPVRSAKIMLKSALAALSRHYAPPAAETRRKKAAILHWGTEDFRPAIRREG